MRGFLFLGLLITSTALAAPTLHARNGESIRVRLGAEHERGIGLRPARPDRPSEWRLELARTDADTADVVDVTAGTAGPRWQVSVADNALHFDTERFVPDHAYRVELRRGLRTVGVALVYLYPPKLAAQKSIRFDDDARGGGSDGGDEMATLPKGSL